MIIYTAQGIKKPKKCQRIERWIVLLDSISVNFFVPKELINFEQWDFSEFLNSNPKNCVTFEIFFKKKL